MHVTQRSRDPGTWNRSRKHSRWENTTESVTYTRISFGWETVKLGGALKQPLLLLVPDLDAKRLNEKNCECSPESDPMQRSACEQLGTCP
jgi:hypothetical protein